MENIPYELIARYLAGECTDSERQQVDEWIASHPDVMEELSEMWQQIPSNNFNPDVEQALQKVNSRIDTKKKNRSRRLIMLLSSAAAVVLVLIVLTGIWNRNVSDNITTPPLLSLNTANNETVEHQLADGSKVWLNYSSTLRYPQLFVGTTREIYLEGEAFFEIAPDSKKPFIIHANGTQTRVVGTSFGIRAVNKESKVVVTVSTGIINFSAEGENKHIELRQGEQGICIPKQQKLEKNANPDPNLLAWKTRKLIFKQSPLAEVARVLESSYHIPVSVDESVSDLRITTTFDALALEEVIRIIEMTLQIKATATEDGIRLSAN